MNVYRFNVMTLSEEIASIKSEHVSEEVKKEIEQNINNLITGKQFFCVQFSKGSTEKVPTQLQKVETYLYLIH